MESRSINSTPSLRGRLNIYTMETGDGRELELSIVDDVLCWRRLNDVAWIPLVNVSELTPQKGVDYWTVDDQSEILEYVASNIRESLQHSDLSGCDASNLHPISSIIGLEEMLANLSADKSYIHSQKSASNIWHVTHNLNKYPNVTIVDSANTVVVGDVFYIDANNIDIKFTGAFTGKAYLN